MKKKKKQVYEVSAFRTEATKALFKKIISP